MCADSFVYSSQFHPHYMLSIYIGRYVLVNLMDIRVGRWMMWNAQGALGLPHMMFQLEIIGFAVEEKA